MSVRRVANRPSGRSDPSRHDAASRDTAAHDAADLRSSEALYARALACMPGGNTRSTLYISPSSPYAVRGSGYEVEDVDGHRLIDLLGNFTVLVHGNAHPAVVAAAVAAIEGGASFGLPSAADVELAERLHERQPALATLRFANSGSEAVMMAIRAARAWTGRDRFLRFAGCYHGTYDAVVNDGAPGRPAALEAEVLSVPVNDVARFRAAMEAHGDELACVLMDLMPNRAGLVPATADFVQLVRQETERRGIVWIVDEVITFRLSLGGMQDWYDVTPDLTVLGKVIGGGFPVGAFGGREDIMKVFDPRQPNAIDHGGTFSANPVTMSAGLAALDLLSQKEIERINGLGDRLRRELQALGYEVNGRGSLLRIVGDVDMSRLWWRLYRSGLLIAHNGLISVSTVMDDDVIDLVLRRFAGAR
ncbi:MAG: aspartate aminotransferase family protein [Thermoleophilia bacterium]